MRLHRLAACSFAKNRLLHRYEANISEVYSQNYLISVDGCSCSNNWIAQLIESVEMDSVFYAYFFFCLLLKLLHAITKSYQINWKKKGQRHAVQSFFAKIRYYKKFFHKFSFILIHYTPLHLCDYLNKNSMKTNVVTYEGNSRNEM